ncbi:MAG: NAD(P)/FAD-dependent oxidoreductase, partial [Panacagrimonas sp.]
MLSATRSTDVVVIGAGVIGLATAMELRRAGVRVTVIDRAAVGRGSASWAGGGILFPLDPDDVDAAMLPLLQDSLAHYANWCAELHAHSRVDPEYRVSGMQVLPPADSEKWAALAAGCGVSVQQGQGDAGLLLREVAQVRSPRLLRALAGAVRALGVELIEHEEVLGLMGSEQGAVTGVRARRRDYAAHRVVLASGAWTQALHAPLSIEPVRGQMLALRAAPGQVPHIVLAQRQYLIPRADGLVVVGSTLERAGFADITTTQGRDALLACAQRLAPGLAQAEVVAHWSGLRPAPQGAAPH